MNKEKWNKFSYAAQVSNIGSEISRAIDDYLRWKGICKNKKENTPSTKVKRANPHKKINGGSRERIEKAS